MEQNMATEIVESKSSYNSALEAIPLVGGTLAQLHGYAGVIRPTETDTLGVRAIKRSAQAVVGVATGLTGLAIVVPD
jgi:hypothetical protein